MERAFMYYRRDKSDKRGRFRTEDMAAHEYRHGEVLVVRVSRSLDQADDILSGYLGVGAIEVGHIGRNAR